MLDVMINAKKNFTLFKKKKKKSVKRVMGQYSENFS